jgi:hypothetical protein
MITGPPPKIYAGGHPQAETQPPPVINSPNTGLPQGDPRRARQRVLDSSMIELGTRKPAGQAQNPIFEPHRMIDVAPIPAVPADSLSSPGAVNPEPSIPIGEPPRQE